ncbi:hypothetical protein [Caballeronia sp. GAOx1]|uniref:hypothetical protein n=1 Tax=Caballeronia sp. GAOx1 TaxID=2921761 RepID=UPI0020285B45|nr:hypothetical protein [Caballeronia sp. GAOx1]
MFELSYNMFRVPCALLRVWRTLNLRGNLIKFGYEIIVCLEDCAIELSELPEIRPNFGNVSVVDGVFKWVEVAVQFHKQVIDLRAKVSWFEVRTRLMVGGKCSQLRRQARRIREGILDWDKARQYSVIGGSTIRAYCLKFDS